MSQSLHLAIRTVHVLAMALLVGGAAGLWAAARRTPDDLHALATGYEWLFWAALGVLVLTGVGNLGALGAPGPATRWGQVLLAKLALVTAFVLGWRSGRSRSPAPTVRPRWPPVASAPTA